MAVRESVVVVVPWRPTPGREPPKRAVCERLNAALPDAPTVFADSGHEPFSRAASRNEGVRQAAAGGAQIVVVCDADTVPEVEPLREAVAQAGVGQLHLPYTRFRMLTERGTADWFADHPPFECVGGGDHDRAVGGVLVCTPGTWWSLGGQDEGFTGWGCEDTAFWAAASTLASVVRHEGAIIHLWHRGVDAERAIGSPAYWRNVARCKLYTDARGDPVRMRAFLAEMDAVGMWSGEPAGV